MTLVIEIAVGLAIGVILMLVVVGLLEMRVEINHEIKGLDRNEKDLHMRHLAKKNEKRVK